MHNFKELKIWNKSIYVCMNVCRATAKFSNY